MIASTTRRVNPPPDDPAIEDTPSGPVLRWLDVRGSLRSRESFPPDIGGAWEHWLHAASAWVALGCPPPALAAYRAALAPVMAPPVRPTPLPARMRARVLATIETDDTFRAALRDMLEDAA